MHFAQLWTQNIKHVEQKYAIWDVYQKNKSGLQAVLLPNKKHTEYLNMNVTYF